MSYAKMKQLCNTVSVAYTNNDKYIPLNSKIYDEIKIKFNPLSHPSSNNTQHKMPEDLKNFEQVVKKSYSEHKKAGGCIPCNKYY